MLLKYFYDQRLAHASYMVGCQKTGEAIIVDPGPGYRAVSGSRSKRRGPNRRRRGYAYSRGLRIRSARVG